MKGLLFVAVATLFSFQSFAGSKILYIGDSQTVGPFGKYMAKELEDVSANCDGTLGNNTVHRFAVSGSSPRHWSGRSYTRGNRAKWLCAEDRKWRTSVTGGTQRLSRNKPHCARAKARGISPVQQLVDAVNPDKVVFIFLGNSSWFMQQALKRTGQAREDYLKKTILKYLTDFMSAVGSRECLMVTSNPQHSSRVSSNRVRIALSNVFKRYMKDYFSHCKFIDGMDKENLRTLATNLDNYKSDKMHLSDQGGQFFANYVSSKLCQ